MIKLTAIGMLGRDAFKNEVNGKAVINFTLASSKKVKGEQKTDWINCSWWTENVGILPYLTKGTQIYVEGEPRARQFTSKAGETGANLDCFVFSVQLLGNSKKDENRSDLTPSRASVTQTSNAKQEEIDDLPF